MKKPNPDPSKHNCFRCEPRGIIRKASVFIAVDGLLNEEKQPLCKECAAEWEKEYSKLNLNDPLFVND